MPSVWFLFQNKLFLLNGNTSDTTPGDHYFHYFIIFIHQLVYVIYIIYLIVMNALLYFKW